MKAKYMKLLITGVGSLGGMIAGAKLAKRVPGQFSNWGKEAVGATLAVGGGYLMGFGDRNVTNLGVGMASTGVGLGMSGVYEKVMGGNIQAYLPESNGNGNGENEEESGSGFDPGDIRTAGSEPNTVYAL